VLYFPRVRDSELGVPSYFNSGSGLKGAYSIMHLRILYLSLLVLALAMFTSAPRLMADGIHDHDFDKHDHGADFSSFDYHGNTLHFDDHHDKGDWQWKGATWDNDDGGSSIWVGKDHDGDGKTTWASTPEPSVLTLLLASVISLFGVSLLKKALA
jgi:hypothetical protein